MGAPDYIDAQAGLIEFPPSTSSEPVRSRFSGLPRTENLSGEESESSETLIDGTFQYFNEPYVGDSDSSQS